MKECLECNIVFMSKASLANCNLPSGRMSLGSMYIRVIPMLECWRDQSDLSIANGIISQCHYQLNMCTVLYDVLTGAMSRLIVIVIYMDSIAFFTIEAGGQKGHVIWISTNQLAAW